MSYVRHLFLIAVVATLWAAPVLGQQTESRIIGNYEVGLERPRDPAEVRHTPEFGAIHKEIWQTLKKEVIEAYRTEDQA